MALKYENGNLDLTTKLEETKKKRSLIVSILQIIFLLLKPKLKLIMLEYFIKNFNKIAVPVLVGLHKNKDRKLFRRLSDYRINESRS